MALVGCQQHVVKQPQPEFVANKAKYIAPDTAGPVRGTGLEAQDIVGMSDEIMKDMLSSPGLMNRKTPARILIDASNFTNESTSRVNLNMITDRLSASLDRAAKGKLVFVDRESAAIVAREREMKRSGVVDSGTVRQTKAQFGVDYSLAARITSHEEVGANGISSRFHFIAFKMLDQESGARVYSGYYEVRKAGVDGAVKYR